MWVVFFYVMIKIVNDRFHVQKLVSEAVQEMRIIERWKAIKEGKESAIGKAIA